MHAWDRPGDPEALARELRERLVLGAFDEGRLVGVVTARLLSAHEAFSDDTAVAPDARGRGIGAALWEALLDQLRALGITEVHGESSAAKMRALRFFLRAGFEVAGTEIARDKPWFREGEVVLRTRLRLGELGKNPVIDFTNEPVGLPVD